MLDIGQHQGASLLGYTPQSALRVLAAVSEPRAPRTVETLWKVCASLQSMGYPVVVLDGSTAETKANPGLAQLLHQAPWQDSHGLPLGEMASSLTVLPAADGLQELSQLPPQEGDRNPLRSLLPYFRTYGLMVLHAPVDLLTHLVGNTQTSPLVFMREGASHMLASYQHCKKLALMSGLACTVAALVPEHSRHARRRAFEALRTLQGCADRHLGGQLHTTTVQAGNSADIQRLALQLLENAGTLESGFHSLPTYQWMGFPAHCVRSH